MRIRARPSRRRLDRITLNLASMIDVTFLLLIYFMVAMVIREREDQLSPTLQTETEIGASSASDFEPQRIDVVLLEGVPSYRLGSRVFADRAALRRALEPLPKSVGIFVNVFDGVPVGFAVAALQVSRDAGFEQVTYVPSE